MIEALISSKTRIKLLLKFFINTNTEAYLRGLHKEFGESTNGIRKELNRLTDAGLLSSHLRGNKKIFRANKKHPLFNDIHSILLKYIGIETIINNVIEGLGNVQQAYLVGDISKGKNSQFIDLVIIGDVNEAYLLQLVGKAESMIDRNVRYKLFDCKDWENQKEEIINTNALLIFSNDLDSVG